MLPSSHYTLSGYHHVLKQILIAIVVLCSGYIVFFSLTSAWLNLLAPVLFIVLLGFATTLFLKQHYPSAGMVIATGMLMAPSWCLWFSGGDQSPLIPWLLHGPVLAGILVHWRAAAILGLLSIANLCAVLILDIDFLEINELPPTHQVHYLFYVIATSSSVIFMCIYVFIMTQEMRKGALQLRQAKEEAEHLAITDRLTGLYNRLKIDERFSHELERMQRYGCSLSAIIIDVDHFKAVNDSFGHPTGDKVLKTLASVIRTNIRAVDVAGRYGGEEFIVLCPETDLKGARTLAEKLRQAIESQEFSPCGPQTASFGVAQTNSGESAESFILRVDRALYRAKDAGRNCVICG